MVKRVPIKDAVAHMDALWRGLSLDQMAAEEAARGQPEPVNLQDPESLI